MWAVGSLTIDDIVYSNAWIAWNIADETMEVRNYDDRFRAFSSYINTSGSLTVVGGDTDGTVQTIDSGNTDNGAPIFGECVLGSLVFTTRGRVKVVNEVIAYASHFQGLRLLMKVDSGKYRLLGNIDSRVKQFKNSESLRGNEFYFKITSVNSGEPFIFDGLEIPYIEDEGYSS